LETVVLGSQSGAGWQGRGQKLARLQMLVVYFSAQYSTCWYSTTPADVPKPSSWIGVFQIDPSQIFDLF
jgi:hypothetical protein